MYLYNEDIVFKYDDTYTNPANSSNVIGSFFNKFNDKKSDKLSQIVEYLIKTSTNKENNLSFRDWPYFYKHKLIDNQDMRRLQQIGSHNNFKKSTFIESDIILFFQLRGAIRESFKRNCSDDTSLIDRCYQYINSIKPVHNFNFNGEVSLEKRMLALDLLTRVVFNNYLLMHLFKPLRTVKRFQEYITRIHSSNEEHMNFLSEHKKNYLDNKYKRSIETMQFYSYLTKFKNEHKCEYLYSYTHTQEIFDIKIFFDKPLEEHDFLNSHISEYW